MLMTDEMLLFTEWPLDVENDPSEEIVESGLGMISTFSENPTRGRDPGLAGDESLDPESGSGEDAGRSRAGAGPDASAGCSKGVFGKLVLTLGEGSSVGSIMLLTSWLDSAADLRCACPRLPPCPGMGSALLLLGSGMGGAAALVGLVLTAFDTPNLESPPTNSLPPLLCPRRGVN